MIGPILVSIADHFKYVIDIIDTSEAINNECVNKNLISSTCWKVISNKLFKSKSQYDDSKDKDDKAKIIEKITNQLQKFSLQYCINKR